MAELRDVVGYICRNYPHKDDLSKARLTKLVYLADWKAAIERRAQMTSIRWRFNHYGPYVDDVAQVAVGDPAFAVRPDWTMYGNRKETIALTHPFEEGSLTAEDRATLDHVIAETRSLSFDGFLQLIYSTYPVLTGVRGGALDLVGAAARYRILEPT